MPAAQTESHLLDPEDFEGIQTPDGEIAVKDILSNLTSGGKSIKVHVHRVLPKQWNGHNIHGKLETFEEPIGEDEIKEMYGGGTFRIQVMVVGKNGKFEYIRGGNRTIRIAGDPIIPKGSVIGVGSAATDTEALAKQAMTTMRELVDRKNNDPNERLFVQSMQDQLKNMQEQILRKDEKIIDLITQKPEPGTADRMIEKMLDQEGARIQMLRAQHESELRTIRERHQGEVDRVHTHYERASQTANEAHLREIQNITRGYEGRIETLNLAHTSALKGLERELSHLDRLYSSTVSERDALRNEKTKSPIDMMKEIATMREAFETLGGGPGEQPTSAWDKLAEVAGPLITGIGQRISDGPAAGNSPPQQQAQPNAAPQEEIPVNQPFRAPDGRVLVRRPDGSFGVVQKKKKPSVEVKGGETVEIRSEDLRPAITFMEAAMRAGTDAKIFAQTVRNVLPPSIQKAFAADKLGVDHFLDQVASLEPGSPLSSQAGRDWIREVAKHVFSV